TIGSTSSDSHLTPIWAQFATAGADDPGGPVSKAVCIVSTFPVLETPAFRTTTVTTFSDRVEMYGWARSRMNVSTLYVLWSGPVRVCTGRHWADAPQLEMVTSPVAPEGRAASSEL